MRKTMQKRREGGQTLLLFVFFLVVLIVFIGLGIDLGFAYITKAQLSKGVDAAALAGMLNLSQGQSVATTIAADTFAANYRKSGRDVNSISPTITFSNDAVTGSHFINVSASTSINTFFIRVMPAIGGADFSRLTVGANAQATRSKLVMSLVLDRSGSMNGNGGAAALPPAVANFINLFDDNNDRAAMVSFSYAPSTDVTMRQPFKTDIKDAANALSFNGWTCSERGLTNGLVQNNTVTNAPGQHVIKVIVFFSDGLANTWYYPLFDCGPQDMAPDTSLYDPTSGSPAPGSCTVPATIPSIGGGTVTTANECGTGLPTDGSMYTEAELRAERIAYLARAASNIVFAIGFGNPNGPTECNRPPLNPDFLKNLANTPDSKTFDPNQVVGDYAIAANATDINAVFQTIAAKILLRLTQ